MSKSQGTSKISKQWATLSLNDKILLSCFTVLVILLVCTGVSLMIRIELNSYFSEYDAKRTKLDDSPNYIVDFAAVLGSDWQTSQGIQRDREDLRGGSRVIAGRSRVFGWNIPNRFAAIDYHIITYINKDKARDRYTVQSKWIFDNQLGVPPSNQLFPWTQRTFDNLRFGADQFRAAYREIFDQSGVLMSVEYAGLFLYGNHVVYVVISSKSGYIDYLSEEQIAQIYTAIDKIMLH